MCEMELEEIRVSHDINKNTSVNTNKTHVSTRWCDMVDESLHLDMDTCRWNDPLVNLDSWKSPFVHVKRDVPRKTYVDLEQKDVRSEGRALREAPHVSREPDTSELRAESEFEPSGIGRPAEVVRHRRGGPSWAKLTSAGVGGGMDRGDGVKPQEPSFNVIVEPGSKGHVCIGGLDTNDEEEVGEYDDGGMSSGYLDDRTGLMLDENLTRLSLIHI